MEKNFPQMTATSQNLKVESDLKSKIVDTIDCLMKNQSKCDGGIDLTDPKVQNSLLQKKGGFSRELILPKQRVVITVKWNKEKLFFACTIAFLKQQKNGKWRCEGRFDDAHGCRHFDADIHLGRTKMFDGQFTEFKLQCPIFSQIIGSLPKEKADEWKINLFKEIVDGNQRKKTYFENPDRIIF